MNILNLTQHQATKEQIEAGVYEPANKKKVQEIITFNSGIPTMDDCVNRSMQLVEIAKEHGAEAVMIAGAPYLMYPLHLAMVAEGIKPLYPYSERISQDMPQPDGTVKKVSIFKHMGFVC